MSIFAIGDLHASRTDAATGRPLKPMDKFGPQWVNHMSRLESAWREEVAEEDTVILVGDIDWALRLEDAMETILRVDRLPGRKILLRGNHDYWWSSKVTNKVRRALPASMELLHNNVFQIERFNVCGAKGSPVPGANDWTEENAKLLNREQHRLETSLQARDPSLPTIAALHYPPFYPSHGESPYRSLLERHQVAACVYGHLHGAAHRSGPHGRYSGIEYYLVAGDAVDFRPVLIAAEGVLAPRRAAPRNGDGMWKEQNTAEPDQRDTRELAEKAMTDKREEVGSEELARELYDVSSAPAADLADAQRDLEA